MNTTSRARWPLPKTRAEQKKLPRSLATRWQARFEFPDNGPPEFKQSLGETAWFLDYQGVRLVGAEFHGRLRSAGTLAGGGAGG